MLTDEFDRAFSLAHDLHRIQTRKATPIPYIAHLMSVSALILEHGGDQEQAIAGLLHDAAEDQGGEAALERIRNEFGDGVAGIVRDCTDAWTQPKPPWRSRKEAYLAALPDKPIRSLLVVLADKTHNAESILYDYRHMGDGLWPRFNAGPQDIRWYYRSLGDIFAGVLPGRLSGRLAAAVAGFGG